MKKLFPKKLLTPTRIKKNRLKRATKAPMTMKSQKFYLLTIFVFSFFAGGPVFSDDTCSPPAAGILGDAALEAGKANPPEGCLQVWSNKLTASEIKNDSGRNALLESWELLAKEIFVGCYRKGEIGVDTEKRYIPASTESIVHTLCTVSVICDGESLSTSGETTCDIL